VGTRGCRNTHVRAGGGEEDFAFHISPKGDAIVFSANSSGGKDIYLFDPKTSQVTRLTNTPAYESGPAYSLDGKSIVYAAGKTGDRADHIYTRPLDGTKSKQLTNEDHNDSAPSFSHDGSYIVFARNLTYAWGGLAPSWGSDGAVYVMKADGTQLRRLTHDNLVPSSPQFMPDGRSIVYWASGQNSEWNVFRIALHDGKSPRQPKKLTSDDLSREATVSPSGQHIAFVSDPTGQGYAGGFRLFTMNSDGTGRRQILKNALANRPAFTPDGRHIYFLGATTYDDWGLWRVDIAGKHLHQVASSRLFENPSSLVSN
jgi:Tol biopolymer transport system component